MKQLNADALIISVIALSWLAGVMVAYLAITVYSAIRRHEKRQEEIPDEEFEYSERPFYQGY